MITKIVVLLLVVLQISSIFTTTRAQSCRGYSFPSNQVFSTCNDLPQLNSYLYWTYNSAAGTADIAFRATGLSVSSNWVAWALNPTAQGMAGAQALVAYQNSTGIRVYTSSVASPNTITGLTPGPLSFQVSKLTATSRGNNEIIIFATIKPPSMTVNQVWQVGPMSGGNPAAHSITGPNIKSTGTINFLSGQTTSTAPGGAQLRKKNIHGVLNAVSWGTLMPLGAIIARYLKVFKLADPAWFYLHIACQLSAYVIGVAGWGTGMKLGSESSAVFQPHRNIGITLFCLATLQVFALLLRPKKEHKFRLYWNIYHHAIGYTVIILSVINIYKGFDILEPLKKWKRTYTGIIIFLGAVALVLEAITWAIVLKRRKNDPAKHGHHANGTNGYGARTQPVV